MSPLEVIGDKPVTMIICDSMVIANHKINNVLYDTIQCSISGGSDSDIMLDICTKFDKDKKIRYVFFDTGIEYQATKEHLDFLEEKYGIMIERIKAECPVPLACKKSGVPFLSKFVSEMIGRLQKYGFKFEDKPLEELLKEYPKASGSVRWWCNDYGEKSRYNINRNKYLKEFLIANPPDFPISSYCCTGAKKNTAKKFDKANNFDAVFIGVRRAESGLRSVRYKTCFTPGDDHDNFRPVFWYTDQDKTVYEDCFNVTHSKCYTEYGLTRTGCAGCPFGSRFEEELKIIEKHEPKLYKAVNNIFGKSYEYTRKYREFKANYKPEKNEEYEQLTFLP